MDLGGGHCAHFDRPCFSLYTLRLYQGIINGPQVADLPVRPDLSWLEGLALAPLVLALVLIGINPHALTTFDTSLYNAVASTAQGIVQ